MKRGCKYGTHRSLEPAGILPQAANRISNDMDESYDNEIVIEVQALNIDSASFTQLKQETGGMEEKMKARILEIVRERGKMKNPVTGSGGVLIGRVEKIGPTLQEKTDLRVGDKIVTLVSLSLTPLRLDGIDSIDMNIDRVNVRGRAILFESGIYAKIPADLSEHVAMAVLDVAGAPAQTAKLVQSGQTVLVLGAAGKSGVLCCYEAKKRVGPTGRVVALVRGQHSVEKLKELNVCHEIIVVDAKDPVRVMEESLRANGGQEFDLSINCMNIPDCEMSCILPVRDGGTVYFFSMATSFTQAALGAEGVGKDVNMIIGNGYSKGHAEIAFQVLRESSPLMNHYRATYC